MGVTQVHGAEFESEVERSAVPVLVDFWAPWCGPCRMLSPLLEQISQERSDVKVCKVNVDEDEELATRFEVSSVPTLLLFKEGKCVSQLVGFAPKGKILALLKEEA